MSCENIDRQLKEIRKTMHEQNERFYREIEVIKKIEILGLKNTVNKTLNVMQRISRTYYQAEERIYELKNRSFEIIQSKENKKN